MPDFRIRAREEELMDDLSLASDELRQNLEELETILHPMVEEASEAVGSMGDDTPVAVLSQQYRGLHHYFRQTFSQVTNPPIDSIRE